MAVGVVNLPCVGGCSRDEVCHGRLPRKAVRMQAQLAGRNGLPTCRPVPATGLRLSAATRVTGERAEVSRRTVRYYVQQSLLAAPRGLARGKHYTPAHLATLVRNLTMQEGGTPPAMIAAALEVEQSSPPKRVHDAARASVRAGPVTSEAP